MKIIHLTDPHLVPAGHRLYGLDPQQRLSTAIADINTHHADAAFALITGDLAHKGEPSAYQALREVLAALRIPCHLLLGNHDDRAAFRSAFPEREVDSDGFVQSVLETQAGRFMLLDTNQPGTHAGWYCERRLAWLDAQLATAPDDVFLAMHHPPLALGIPPLDVIGLAQQRELAAVVARHGKVRHVFFGHVHRPVHGAWGRISISTQRALNHQVAPCFEETPGCIPGSHEPPAYAVVLIEPHSLVIHDIDFLDKSPRFDLFDRSAEFATTPLALTARLR